jgi:hypothetical protein
MAFAVVATANHYVLDVVVGCGVALTALLVASRLSSWKRRVARAQLPSR